MKKTGIWTTRFGFYLIAMSSAFGLGNIWRFPYVVAENGGGAFLLLYVFLVFVIGTPVIIGELILGRISGKGFLSAIKSTELNVPYKKLSAVLSLCKPHLGKAGLAICLLILSYFSVVSGTVLYYCIEYFVSATFSENLLSTEVISILKDNWWLQVTLTSVHLLLTIIVVAENFDESLEIWVGYITPAFFIFLIALAIKSLSLETSPDALRYFFYPDFSQLNLSSLSFALGHVLFSLSLGFGTMIGFGKLLRSRTYIPGAGLKIATLDSVLSLFAGLLIFPLVVLGANSFFGPDLLFKTVPLFLNQIPKGDLFGFVFFLCLYLAALGSSISLLETIVNNLVEHKKVKRVRGAWGAGFICLVLAVLPALSSSLFSFFSFKGMGIFQIFDVFLVNWMLPLVALILSQVVVYGLSHKNKRNEFVLEESPVSETVFAHWSFFLKWLFPIIVLVSMLLQMISVFKN